MIKEASESGSLKPAGRGPALMALRGRLNRRRSDRKGQPALAEELASALALAELARELDPELRTQLVRRAARHLHPRGLEMPTEGSN